MPIGIEDRVVISSATWPSRADVPPGDLSRYAPIGLGMSVPMVMQPWDGLDDAMDRGSFYDASERSGDPFRDAPRNDAGGGTIYFDSGRDPQKLSASLEFLGVDLAATGYCVFAEESKNPVRDRYLAQIRIVEFGAMNLFGAIPDPGDAPRPQQLTLDRLIGAFIDAQREIWGSGMSSKLGGTLGGDGDWAKEKLAFGFMIENASNGVYRLWSRPWLVTK